MAQHNRGFFTIIALLVGVAIISFVIYKYASTNIGPGEKTILEEGVDAVKKAEDLKIQLENQGKLDFNIYQ